MTSQRKEEKQLFCPYCEDEAAGGEFNVCQACGVTIFYCPECRKPLSRENRFCPHCGAEIKG